MFISLQSWLTYHQKRLSLFKTYFGLFSLNVENILFSKRETRSWCMVFLLMILLLSEAEL